MANGTRHAAWQTQYEVRECAGALDLGPRHVCSDYLEAVEFALDYLAEHDPDRAGAVESLVVDRVHGDGRTTMWRYDADETAPQAIDPSRRWGFDIMAWRGPAYHAA